MSCRDLTGPGALRQRRRLFAAPATLAMLTALSACGRNEVVQVADDGGTDVTTFDTTDTDDTDDTEVTVTSITESETETDDWTESETESETWGPDLPDEPECGNGLLEDGEECDPGDDEIGPNAFCLPGCIEARCGDGFWWFEGEECDDGNQNDNDACTADCTEATCGDGSLWQGVEACDDGNQSQSDACVECEFATCGDGFTWTGQEDCDDGNFSSNDACVNCQAATCGDGFIWEGVEACDDGPFGNQPSADCTPECTVFECGDGWLHSGEECDPGPGGFFPNSNCFEGCVLGTCGDGVVGANEQCDDGNDDNTDACTDTCQDANCGDGFVWDGVEGCDEGSGNAPDGDCTPLCQPNVCGDGFKHPDEECDPGAANIGPGLDCLPGCVLNECGDGDVGPSEQCDDGNAIDTDACTNACVDATCGDAIVWEGVEECDDANANDTDACHNDCTDTRITKVAIGGNHTCALYDFGSFRCWGNGDDGRTAQGSEVDIGDDEPANAGVLATFSPIVTDIYTGISHTCTILQSGQLTCFGRGDDGQLGYGSTEDIGDDEAPTSSGTLNFGGATVQRMGLRGGAFHNCVLLSNGNTHCWGLNEFGVLGVPGVTESIGDELGETPTDAGAVLLGGTPDELTAGRYHSCARIGDALRCWGLASQGALGYGNSENIGDDETPASAGDVPVGAPVAEVVAGFLHTCARTTTGNVRCWGRGANGRLGYGNSTWIGTSLTPTDVGDVDIGGVAVQVVAGNAHTCVLLDDASVRCWGWGGRGQLGYGNLEDIGDNELPSTAGPVQLPGPVSYLAADGNMTCAVVNANEVYCWGDPGDGRLGYGNLNQIGDDETPQSVGPVQLF